MNQGMGREILYRAIQAYPGLGIRGLSRVTGLTTMTVMAHASALVAESRIRVQKDGTKHRHYVKGHRAELTVPPELEALLEYVCKNPHVRQVDVIRAFPELPRSTVQHRLQRLALLGRSTDTRKSMGRARAPG